MSGDDLSSTAVLGALPELRGRHLFIVHGALDGLIDVWHRWLNLPDGARPRFQRDAYRLEGRARLFKATVP